MVAMLLIRRCLVWYAPLDAWTQEGYPKRIDQVAPSGPGYAEGGVAVPGGERRSESSAAHRVSEPAAPLMYARPC